MSSPLVHTLRLARRAPAVVCAAVVALAIGIAGNTIIFSVVDAALLRPVPYDRPDRLVTVEEYSPQSDPGGASYDDYLDWRRDRGPFEDLAVGNWGTFNLTGPAGPEQVFGANVSPSLFSVLHVAPFTGSSVRRRRRIDDGGARRHRHVRCVARTLSERSRDHRPHRHD